MKRSHNGRKNGSLKHGNTAAHTDDDMMKLFKPGSTQLKSSQQKVNEALRHKLSQMVVVRQKLERKLSSTVNEVTRTRVCNSKLKKLLSRCYIRLNLISERIKLRSKSRAGMSGVDGRVTHTASAAEQEMDMAFDEEYHQTRATISKLLGYLNYGKQVYSYVDQVRERLQNQLMDTNAVLQLDRQCLELGGSGSAHRRKLTTGGVGGGGGGGGKMFNKSARRRLASANASPTNMITIHQLFEHESAIKRSAQSFAQQANKCLEEETKKIKEVYRKSNIAIRTCLRQSGELKNHIQIEILANKAKIPVLIKREKELKSLLAQQFKPLELCQRRYEIRMERATNAMVSDLVQQELEEELEGLGEKVQRLESTLKHVQEELRILMDIDIQLKSQLLTEQNHMTFYQHCLDVEKKSEHDELQKHKKKTNGEDQDKASGSNEKKQLRGAHKQNHNKYTSNKKLYINHSNRTKKKNTTMSKSLPSSHSSRPTSSHQLKSPSVYGLSASSNRGMYASPTKHRSGNTKAGGEIRFSSYQ